MTRISLYAFQKGVKLSKSDHTQLILLTHERVSHTTLYSLPAVSLPAVSLPAESLPAVDLHAIGLPTVAEVCDELI